VPIHLIIAALSYLLGSIPFGYILVRIFRKQDIRETGSGNIGATNVARSGAKGLALLTLVLDVAKGAAAVLIAGAISRHFFIEHWDNLGGPMIVYKFEPFDQGLAALFAVLGHMYPAWLRFRGGKGVATAAGAFLVISPGALGIALVVFLVVVAVFRYVSLGSIISAALFPGALALAASPNWHIYPYISYVIAAIIAALIILKHHANIRRLFAGTEPKLGAKPPTFTQTPPSPDQMEKRA